MPLKGRADKWRSLVIAGGRGTELSGALSPPPRPAPDGNDLCRPSRVPSGFPAAQAW